jgi:hypothetical protein
MLTKIAYGLVTRRANEQEGGERLTRLHACCSIQDLASNAHAGDCGCVGCCIIGRTHPGWHDSGSVAGVLCS